MRAMTPNKPDPLEVSPYVQAASERAQSYAQLVEMFAPQGPYNGNDCYMIEEFDPAPMPRAPRQRWLTPEQLLVSSLCAVWFGNGAFAVVTLALVLYAFGFWGWL